MSLAPEVLEPVRRQLGVAHRVLDVLVPEPCLQRPGVVAGVGPRVAATVAQHVRMDREWHLRPRCDPAKQCMKSLRRHGASTFGHERMRGDRLAAVADYLRTDLAGKFSRRA